jgi:hypothetical protein
MPTYEINLNYDLYRQAASQEIGVRATALEDVAIQGLRGYTSFPLYSLDSAITFEKVDFESLDAFFIIGTHPNMLTTIKTRKDPTGLNTRAFAELISDLCQPHTLPMEMYREEILIRARRHQRLLTGISILSSKSSGEDARAVPILHVPDNFRYATGYYAKLTNMYNQQIQEKHPYDFAIHLAANLLDHYAQELRMSSPEPTSI